MRDAPSHDGGRAGHETDGEDDLLHSIMSAKVVVLWYVCLGVHRGALDGTPSSFVYVIAICGVVIDDGWPRTKWHALHVVLCRETARRCVCGEGVKVKGPRRRMRLRLQVLMVEPPPFVRLRQVKG